MNSLDESKLIALQTELRQAKRSLHVLEALLVANIGLVLWLWLRPSTPAPSAIEASVCREHEAYVTSLGSHRQCPDGRHRLVVEGAGTPHAVMVCRCPGVAPAASASERP